MLETAMAAMVLATVSAADARMSALSHAVVIPDARSSTEFRPVVRSPDAAERKVILHGPLARSAVCTEVCLRLSDIRDASAVKVSTVTGPPPDSEPGPGFVCAALPVPAAPPYPAQIIARESRGLSDEVLAAAVDRMIYDSLLDGTIDARAPKWRMPLVKMLVDGAPGADFDYVYTLLRKGFGGNDEQAKIRALAKWASERLPPHDAADVYRAETRYWLELGDPLMAVDAARRMERARPDYAVRARRLSALAYATSGDFARARSEIARSRAECSPVSWERHELLYLEAWIWLQEGDAAAAERNLRLIVSDGPGSETGRKALAVLRSISEEVK